MTDSTSTDGLTIIVNLINQRFDSLEGSVSDVKTTVATLEARPSITPEQHAWIAEGAKRDADAAEQRQQLDTARRLNRRGYVLGVFGAGLASLSAVMNYGHAITEAVARTLGGH